VEVLRPATLEHALRLRTERPDAVPIQGGTDLMVGINLGRLRPTALIDLSRLAELRGWSGSNGRLRIGAGATYTDLMKEPLRKAMPVLAAAARTVGSPQIRNRGTIGGAVAQASIAGDAIPPLVVADGEAEMVSLHGSRRVAITDLTAASGEGRLAGDELVAAVHVRPAGARQTFMKVGGRNAMARAVVSLALAADRERDELRVAFSSGCSVRVVESSLADAATLPGRVTAACQPIEDVHASAAYRRHAVGVLAARAVERCMP
jgi:CO/xanthine dehydrogenase FAD-binding subunit